MAGGLAEALLIGQAKITAANVDDGRTLKDVLEVARVALQVNVAKEGRRLPRSASKALEALVG